MRSKAWAWLASLSTTGQFCDLSLTTDDIAQNMLDNRETWTTILNRSYMGRHIILSGRKRDALTRIIGSRASPRTRQQAERFLNEPSITD